MKSVIIQTPEAPNAIGSYSLSVRVGNTVYLSGQIGLDPSSMLLVEGIDAQIERVLENLKAVAKAAGGSLANVVKMTVFMTDLANFSRFNEATTRYFAKPYPVRTVVGVAALPRGALVEAEAIMVFSD